MNFNVYMTNMQRSKFVSIKSQHPAGLLNQEIEEERKEMKSKIGNLKIEVQELK